MRRGVTGEQRLVGAAVGHGTVLDHHDLVRYVEQRRAGGHDDGGSACAPGAEPCRRDGLGDRVDGRRRVVYDQDGGISGQRPRQGDALAPATRQRHAASGDLGVHAVRQRGLQILGPDSGQECTHILWVVGKARRDGRQVVEDRPRQERCLMASDHDVLSQPVEAQGSERDAVDLEVPGRRVLSSGHQVDDDRCVGRVQCCPCDERARVDLEVQVMQAAVGHRAERDPPSSCRVAIAVHRRSGVEQAGDATGRSSGLGQLRSGEAESPQRADQELRHADRGHERPDRHAPVGSQAAGDEGDNRHEGAGPQHGSALVHGAEAAGPQSADKARRLAERYRSDAADSARSPFTTRSPVSRSVASAAARAAPARC